jgi:hypothetical protein
LVVTIGERDVYCPHCAYNLRGVESPQCPECGSVVDRTVLAQSILPWAQRKRLGWIRAYWRTVFRSKNLLAEIGGNVSLTDARWFWAITVLHAWTPFVLATLALAFNAPQPSGGQLFPIMVTYALLMGSAAAVWPVAIVALGMLAWLAASTGAPSYFCHPQRLEMARQNNAVAISYYACAALAFVAPVSLLLAVAIWLSIKLDSDVLAIIAWAAAGLFLVWVMLEVYMRTVRLVTSATRRGTNFLVGFGIALPAIWAFLFVLLGLGLPAMVVYAVLFVISRT